MKKSIDLIEKEYNSKLSINWSGSSIYDNLFVDKYIIKHYSNLLHYIPYIQIDLRNIEESLNNFKLNFQIHDVTYGRIYNYHQNKKEFKKYYKLFKNTNKRFTFFPINHFTYNLKGLLIYGHMTSAIYDKSLNQIEYFDPNDDILSKNKERYLINFFSEIYGRNIKIILSNGSQFFWTVTVRM